MKTLFALAFLLCISVAFGLKCYTCSSSSSMDECDDKRKETDCPSGADRCSKSSIEYKSSVLTLKMFAKSCATKSVCDAASTSVKACKDADGAKCEADCCDGDLCNGGVAPMISVLLMVACALVALFR